LFCFLNNLKGLIIIIKFNYYLPVNLIFGWGMVSGVGTETAKYGKKALIVTGKGSTKKSGLLDMSISLLKDAGVCSVIFDKVPQNPLTVTAEEGTRFAKENGCDVVVGIGGGSTMDAAKGIAFLAKNEGDITDYIFGKKKSDEALPLVLVPTTCGTGSEGNCFAVLSNPFTNDKKSLRCNAITAKSSIIDPEVMTTMPKRVLASVGFDALCHNMEGYISTIGQPITDMLALEGIRLIGESLPRVYEDYSDKEAWEKLTWGSTLGGMVINTAGVTGPHGMEHPASGLRNIVHGKGLAALTPWVYEASIKGAPDKFAAISKLLGGQNENDCVDRIRLILEKIGLSVTLSEQGVLEEDIGWMTENCMKVSAASINNHPVVFNPEEISTIYRKAL
jgi:alcohol dehydrogenase class IV